MFLEIAFCFFVLVVRTSSAQAPCPNNKEILDKFKFFYEDKNAKHCFFRLPEAKEKDARKVKAPENDRWFWDKPKAAQNCRTYDATAFLPRLKDGKMSEFLLAKVNGSIVDHSLLYSILLGTKKVDVKGAKIKITWDDDSSLEIDGKKGIHGMPDREFEEMDPGRCFNVVDMDLKKGFWSCHEPGAIERVSLVFCQVTSPKGATTAPKGATTAPSAVEPFSKVAMATATLVICQLLSRLVTE